MSDYFVYSSRAAFDAAAVSGQEWGVNAFSSISDAIANVENGGTIHLTAGTYNEAVSYSAAPGGTSKGFTLSGAVDANGQSLVDFTGTMLFGAKTSPVLNQGITPPLSSCVRFTALPSRVVLSAMPITRSLAGARSWSPPDRFRAAAAPAAFS